MTLSVAFAEPAHAKKYKIEQPPSNLFLFKDVPKIS